MRIHGKLERFTFESKHLEGNPLGDPSAREVIVYVPPGLHDGQRLPTVTMLPGYVGHPSGMVSFDPFKRNTIELLDAQIVEGECLPFFLVLPDCMTRWGGSQFLDSPAHGAYQRYLLDEVLPEVDARFPTIAAPEGRAMVGRSSGGFGALRAALDRPGVISVVASHAGDALFEVTMRPMLTAAATAMARAGGVASFAEKLVREGPKGQLDFDAAFVLAAAASYSPNPSSEGAVRIDLPVDLETGRLRDDVWARWLENDPVELVRERRDAASKLRFVFLDAGDADEHGLHFAARALRDLLREAGVRVAHEEFPGGHRGTSHRYTVSLPLVSRELAR
jgi:enterochelin esterase-like enzyme